MPEGYNFQRLKSAILPLSRAADWEMAKREWRLIGISEADEPESCPCGHFPIIDLCTISNSLTSQSIDVGNVCVKRFLGLRSDLIFNAVKRIRKELSKSIGADAAVFFHAQGVINDWEYSFVNSTLRKRALSFKQLETRQRINAKILASIRRRGLPN
jgi:hypothetical protein